MVDILLMGGLWKDIIGEPNGLGLLVIELKWFGLEGTLKVISFLPPGLPLQRCESLYSLDLFLLKCV